MATVGVILGATAGTAAAAAIGTAAVIGGVATAGSLVASRKARKQQEKAMALDAKRSKLQSGRAAIEQVRQSQIARASVLQQGENRGAGDSTAVAGSLGSIQSQTGGNVAFAETIFGLQNSASKLRQSAGKFASISSGISQLGSLGMNLASAGAFTSGGTGGSGTVMNDNFRGIGS